MDLVGALILYLGVPMLFLYLMHQLGVLKMLNKVMNRKKRNRKWK